MAQQQTKKESPSLTSNGSSEPIDRSKFTIASRLRRPSGRLTYTATTIYGPAGVGKTTLLSTMPGNGIVIDVPQVEGGTHVLEPWADRIEVLPVVKWEEVEEVYQMIKHDDGRTWRWVGVDSLTAMMNLAKRKARKDRESGIAIEPTKTTQQDWGAVADLLGDMIDKFMLLRIHRVFICQNRTDDGYFHPDLSPGATRALIPPMFLAGYYYSRMVETEEGKPIKERRLRVGQHENYITKTRSVPGRDLPDVIKNPNLSQILAWSLGAEKAARPEEAEEYSGFDSLIVE